MSGRLLLSVAGKNNSELVYAQATPDGKLLVDLGTTTAGTSATAGGLNYAGTLLISVTSGGQVTPLVNPALNKSLFVQNRGNAPIYLKFGDVNVSAATLNDFLLLQDRTAEFTLDPLQTHIATIATGTTASHQLRIDYGSGGTLNYTNSRPTVSVDNSATLTSTAQVVTTSGSVAAGAHTVSFFNSGTITLTVNGATFKPGASFTYPHIPAGRHPAFAYTIPAGGELTITAVR